MYRITDRGEKDLTYHTAQPAGIPFCRIESSVPPISCLLMENSEPEKYCFIISSVYANDMTSLLSF
jgi:hypothetical protein